MNPMLPYLPILLAFASLAPPISAQQQAYKENLAYHVPLAPNAGSSDRHADHATVAISSDKHVAVAFHSDRDDLDPGNTNAKQVEVALFRYTGTNPQGEETWEHDQTVVLGDPARDPLGYLQTDNVCERPDVIAVGDFFFITWTRRYDDIPNEARHPSTIECAWIEWDGQQLQFDVYDNPLAPPGVGYLLDRDSGNSHLYTRDCRGIVDAAVLHEGGSNDPRIAAVYAHQTEFPAQSNGDRSFDLRAVTCSFDPGTNLVSSEDFSVMKSGVRYNGPTTHAALILPDVASSGDDHRLFVTLEEQVLDGGQRKTRIILSLWEEEGPSSNQWSLMSLSTFVGQTAQEIQARPMVDSYPPSTGGKELVSIAFGVQDLQSGDRDIVYELWDLTNGASQVPWPGGYAWNNSAESDDRPVPLMGRVSLPAADVKKLFLDHQNQAAGVCELQEADVDSNSVTVLHSYATLARPAVSYHFDGAKDFMPVSWEQEDASQPSDPREVWFMVRVF